MSPTNDYNLFFNKWMARACLLLGLIVLGYLKPRITKLSLPDYNTAKDTDELQHFLGELPGFGSAGDEGAARDQYGFVQVGADQFILHEKH